MDISTQLGVYRPHPPGSYSCASEVTMITKRSYHIPMLTKIVRAKRAGSVVRIFLNHSACGTTTLQNTMTQKGSA